MTLAATESVEFERKRRRNKHFVAPLGRVFGDREVISSESKSHRRNTEWLVRCKCGEEHWIEASRLLQGKQGKCAECKRDAQRTSLSSRHFPGYPLREAIERSRKRGIVFDLTLEDVLAQLEKQEWLCVYTGALLTISRTISGRREGTTISLDRIDSSKGYTADNLQIVHKRVNSMKNDMSHGEFVAWCRRVAQGPLRCLRVDAPRPAC